MRRIPKYGRSSSRPGRNDRVHVRRGEHQEVPLTRKTSSPPGRSSRAASAIHRSGSHQMLAPYSETARSNDSSGQRHVLGARMDERELEPVLRLHAPRGRELLRARSTPVDPCPAPGEPGRHVRGTAAELDHVLAGDLAEQLDLALGHLEHPPGDLLGGPVALGAGDVLLRPLRPRLAVATACSVRSSDIARSPPSATTAPTRSPPRCGTWSRRPRAGAPRRAPRSGSRARGTGGSIRRTEG